MYTHVKAQWPREFMNHLYYFCRSPIHHKHQNVIANSLKLTTSMETELNVKVFLKGTAVVALNTDRFSTGLWRQ